MDLNTENVPSLVPPLRTEPDQDARKAVAASRAAINAVLRNKSIRELMQQRFPIDTRDANRQELVLLSHAKLGRAHQRAYANPQGDASVRNTRGLKAEDDGQYCNVEPTHEGFVASAAHEAE